MLNDQLSSRALMPTQMIFEEQHTDYKLDVQEVRTSEEMLHFTPMIACLSLMISDKLVCVRRYASRHEILTWLEQEVEQGGPKMMSTKQPEWRQGSSQ